MNVFKSFSIILFLLASAPLAADTIYKCDGPDGPIFSDKPCAPDASTVTVKDTTGLSADYDGVRSDLAEKKTARNQEGALSKNNQKVNPQPQTYTSESNGRWVRGRERLGSREKPSQPIARPVTPRKGAGGRRN